MDLRIALQFFIQRFLDNRSNRDFSNSDLPAGASMYYHCRGCWILIDTRPEGWIGSPPPRYCTPCYELIKQGVPLEKVIDKIEQQKIESLDQLRLSDELRLLNNLEIGDQDE